MDDAECRSSVGGSLEGCIDEDGAVHLVTAVLLLMAGQSTQSDIDAVTMNSATPHTGRNAGLEVGVQVVGHAVAHLVGVELEGLCVLAVCKSRCIRTVLVNHLPERTLSVADAVLAGGQHRVASHEASVSHHFVGGVVVPQTVLLDLVQLLVNLSLVLVNLLLKSSVVVGLELERFSIQAVCQNHSFL